jgi:hypothetical protein
MTAALDFLKANKGKIALGVVFVLGGLKAIGVEVPSFVTDLITASGLTN